MKRDDRGTITVFVSVFMIALIAVAGLVIDGGSMLAARREASNVAESAARAGAQAIDEDCARAGDGVRLNPVTARRRAEDYLTAAGYQGTVSITGDSVSVVVTIDKQLFILGVVGVADRSVTGRGSAHGVRGVTQEGN
ncbi:MAG: TadE/TadG family type IV pilus assembly protein [Acidimicrobiia bacterium]